MRKKCDSCDFICFMSDESCKKCGSHQLSVLHSPNALSTQEFPTLQKSRKLKFVKYFVFMIFAQFGLLFVGGILKLPIIFQVFYEPVFTVVLSFVKMGHADVILPLLLIGLTFLVYATALSYLLVYSRFRESVFMPIRKEVHIAFAELRTTLNGK